MRNALKTVMFVSALSPSLISVALARLWDRGPTWDALWYALVGCVGILLIRYIIDALRWNGEIFPVTLKKVESNDALMLGVIVTYFIPFIGKAADITVGAVLVMLALAGVALWMSSSILGFPGLAKGEDDVAVPEVFSHTQADPCKPTAQFRHSRPFLKAGRFLHAFAAAYSDRVRAAGMAARKEVWAAADGVRARGPGGEGAKPQVSVRTVQKEIGKGSFGDIAGELAAWRERVGYQPVIEQANLPEALQRQLTLFGTVLLEHVMVEQTRQRIAKEEGEAGPAHRLRGDPQRGAGAGQFAVGEGRVAECGRLAGQRQARGEDLAAGRPKGPGQAAQAWPHLGRGRLLPATAGGASRSRLVLRFPRGAYP
jgi:hypothetical protein